MSWKRVAVILAVLALLRGTVRAGDTEVTAKRKQMALYVSVLVGDSLSSQDDLYMMTVISNLKILRDVEDAMVISVDNEIIAAINPKAIGKGLKSPAMTAGIERARKSWRVEHYTEEVRGKTVHIFIAPLQHRVTRRYMGAVVLQFSDR